jgi:hypothetical protein
MRISNLQCVEVLAPCGSGCAVDISEEHVAFIILGIHCAKVLPGTSSKFSPHPLVTEITPGHKTSLYSHFVLEDGGSMLVLNIRNTAHFQTQNRSNNKLKK